MHWPVSSASGSPEEEYLEAGPPPPSFPDQLIPPQTWHAMERLLPTGKVRAIGVSNFSPAQLARLLAHSATRPAVHQMELHPYLPQMEWLLLHHARGIHVTAFSPLGDANPAYRHGGGPARMLGDGVLGDVAAKRNCTVAQVALSWGLGRGTSVIVKSAHEERIEENFASGRCRLEYEDLVRIERTGRRNRERFNNPSELWGVHLYEGLQGS
jgi:alcohol dehydrogenase (NADP+)